ncbi:Uncharacterised protein [Porphyromonas cangingivalis]|uniref:Uncharacterized protein n=1 Tax=Porphyromonas cangingivalis TaxID=36874 RepID=A0A1T4MN11_PORCN|nr:hypothetical protein SAMN02745205_01590 [Porphyromonas cangingivalis]VEJ03725.1 Uncharacterised protein [Porphyromonas cangingivalis]
MLSMLYLTAFFEHIVDRSLFNYKMKNIRWLMRLVGCFFLCQTDMIKKEKNKASLILVDWGNGHSAIKCVYDFCLFVVTIRRKTQ